MFKFNVEIKKHCRNFRKIDMGCGCHLSQKRGFEYTCTSTFDSISIYSYERQSYDILERYAALHISGIKQCMCPLVKLYAVSTQVCSCNYRHLAGNMNAWLG